MMHCAIWEGFIGALGAQTPIGGSAVPAGSPEFRVKVPLLHSKRKYNSADLTTSMASAEFMFLHYANVRVFENLMGGQ